VTAGSAVAALTIDQAAAAASISLNPTTQSVGVAGQSGLTVSVTSNLSSWAATSSSSAVTITAGASGSGNGMVTYSVAANSGSGPLSATITVAGPGGSPSATLAISQPAATLSISPTSQSFPFGTAQPNQTAAVTATTNLAWAAVSDQPWLTITSGASGAGNGTIIYDVATNSGGSRTGHITVSGNGLTAVLTVTQGAGLETAPPR
jgi:hypothetical protein